MQAAQRSRNEERNLKKGGTYLWARKLKLCVFIDNEKNNYPLKVLCRVVKVSPGGYYARRKKLTKPPSIRRKTLKQSVK